jgi:hypothetical protein
MIVLAKEIWRATSAEYELLVLVVVTFLCGIAIKFKVVLTTKMRFHLFFLLTVGELFLIFYEANLQCSTLSSRLGFFLFDSTSHLLEITVLSE